MREKFVKEMNDIKFMLYKFGSKVVSQISASVEVLTTGNSEIAEQIKKEEKAVDEMEKDIERQCFRILLSEQPVASDFRRVSALNKMITDIERIGDHAEDIASLALELHGDEFRNSKILIQMCDIAKNMLTLSVNGYINGDFEQVRSVEKMDDDMDSLFRKMKKQLASHINGDIEQNEDVIAVLMIAKYLERIGDHAVNVSEWAMYSWQVD